jgi:acetyl/propionyl-CoA carboxylase alpha subunit
MIVVEGPDDITEALASSRRIARAAFDDDRLLLERYLMSPRHVEVQVMADAHGSVVHLGERDCSLQRRHQKLMEETPAPNLDPSTRDELCRAAVALASRANYAGAGTCEFLVGPNTFGFIEMNARLQVEHPVTELTTGFDLIELQLRVALGERLPIAQSDVRQDGHAIEVRIYAEDPQAGFLPQSGRVLHINWPDHARIDTGVEEGTDVTTYYDPLLAKLVVHGSDRTAALWELHRALDRVEILGPRTNVTFLNAITRDPTVVEGGITTDWLEHAYDDRHVPTATSDVAVAVAAAAEAERHLAGAGQDPWSRLGPWRAGARGAARIVLRPDGEERAVTVEGMGPFVVEGTVTVARGSGCHEWRIGGHSAAAARTDDAWLVWWSGVAYEIAVGPAIRRLAGAGPSRLDSPLPGQVIAVRVEPGQQVDAGDELVIVEAMKMEHAVRAPSAGVVRAVLCAPGDRVDRGQSLVDFEPA